MKEHEIKCKLRYQIYGGICYKSMLHSARKVQFFIFRAKSVTGGIVFYIEPVSIFTSPLRYVGIHLWKEQTSS